MNIHLIGEKLYILYDPQLQGYITWEEKKTVAIFMFTSGEKAEEYAERVYPFRNMEVWAITKNRATILVGSLIKSGVQYALIDVPWEHADLTTIYADETVRDYAIVDLSKVKARLMG